MNIEAAKQLIKKYTAGHAAFIAQAMTARRYYLVNNDILYAPKKQKQEVRNGESAMENPLRNADNRIPFSFYQLLVNQKASYMFSAPPLFDVKDEGANEQIVMDLGDAYKKKCMELCVNACNAGIGWVHYWKGPDSEFHWGVVPSEEVIPVWSSDLDHSLVACLRAYQDIDEDGHMWDLYEIWGDRQCQTYRKRNDEGLDSLVPWARFATGAFLIDLPDGDANVFNHDLGRVPFIPFQNNSHATSDLAQVKKLIDCYDRVFSGFLNDLEDIQEVIFVLTNYGGEDLGKFLKDLKYYKAISLEDGGTGSGGNVSTLTINIPVEARDKMLEITRKAIFSMGQGVDPEQQGMDKTSGEAMKFLYALLELKAGMTETEFSLSFNELIRAILRFHGMDKLGKARTGIIQTWTRTAIRNDAELVDMCAKSEGIVSRKTLLKNHPFVEDVGDEEKELEAEEKAQNDKLDPYDDLKDEGGDGNA